MRIYSVVWSVCLIAFAWHFPSLNCQFPWDGAGFGSPVLSPANPGDAYLVTNIIVLLHALNL